MTKILATLSILTAIVFIGYGVLIGTSVVAFSAPVFGVLGVLLFAFVAMLGFDSCQQV